jgi:hypothetical protein
MSMMMPIAEFKEAFDSFKHNERSCKLKKTFSEVGLCEILKKSNLFPNYTLHEEVGISGVSCDLVYENGERVFTIEAKTELNYKVFAQASRWRNVATASYIAVPVSVLKDWYYSPKKVILEELGLGLIVVDEQYARFARGYDPFEKDVYVGANSGIYLFPADLDYWKDCFERIGENQAPAGSKIGKRSTTFTRTIDALKLEAQKHPDYTLQQLLLDVPTHYSNITSAEQAIKRYAKLGIIDKFWQDKPKAVTL